MVRIVRLREEVMRCSKTKIEGSGGNQRKIENEKSLDVRKNRVLPIRRVGDTGPATTAKSSGKPLIEHGGAAKSAADDEVAAIVDAWPLLGKHSRSIIIGMARKAVANSTITTT